MTKMFFILIFSAIISVSQNSYAANWLQVVAQIDQNIKETKDDIEETRKIIQSEQTRLKQELSSLREEVSQDEKSLQASKDEFELLLQAEEKLREEVGGAEENIKALEEILKTAAKDVIELVNTSLITYENPLKKELLAPFLKPDRFPNMENIENLVKVLFEEIEKSGEIRKYNGAFINSQGTESAGTILRIGKFTACYQQGNEIGYLKSDKELSKPVAIPGNLPRSIRRSVQKYFAGENDSFPLDLSGGVIMEQVSRSQDIHEWIRAGGILMYPLFMVGVAAMLLTLERLYSLGRISAETDKLMDCLRNMISKGDLKAGEELCEKNKKIPTFNVLKSGLQHACSSKEILENAIEEAILKELPRLERFLTTLAMLAGIAPLLGLLGTVSGMIHTFEGITIFGTSDPRMMSGGISEALITTEVGLAVAIPIMIVHHFFDRRVEKIIADMEEKGTSLITCVIKSESEMSIKN